MASSEPAGRSVLLLDTNIVMVYAREGEPYQRLEQQLQLQSGDVRGLISIVTLGEARSLTLKWNWGAHARERLANVLSSHLLPVDINNEDIINAYVKIDHYSERVIKPARPMGQNDMWIAATALALHCELVTMDKDFDHLHGHMIDRRWIDQASLKAPTP